MNKKLFTKTLIASALVLTTVGSGFHPTSNYNSINHVAKAAETTDDQ
ncbi:Ear protein [Staphylococcus schweitzeri]|nr:Ear protein [Staphylococcus schweitzeri]